MDIEIFKKNKKSLLVMGIGIIIGMIGLFLFPTFLIFTIFLVGTGILNFVQSRMELPFDLTPSLAILILFSIKLGFLEGMIFLILGSIIPGILGGGFNHMTLFFFLLAMGISYLGSSSLIGDLRIYGIVLIVIQGVFSYLIIKLFSVDPTDILSVFLGFFVNISYFLVLSELIASVLV